MSSKEQLSMKFVKTHEDAKLPERAHDSDSGYDLYSVSEVIVPGDGSVVVPVGLTLGYLTPGWWFRVEPRSGLGFKHNLQPHLGIIDNGYRVHVIDNLSGGHEKNLAHHSKNNDLSQK